MTIEYTGSLSKIRAAFRGLATVTGLVGSNAARVTFVGAATASDLPHVDGCSWWDVTPAYRDNS